MSSTKTRLLHDSLRRYLQQGAEGHLRKLIGKTRAEDLAATMQLMPQSDQLEIFGLLPDIERKANVITEMASPFGKHVLNSMPPKEAAAILFEMASDDAADLLADLEPERVAAILEVMDESEEIEELLEYGPDTAGGIMIPEFVALRADETAEQALARLQQAGDVEMAYYIYVVNAHGHLVGVLSLRKLVTAPRSRLIGDIMETDVVSVRADADQEDVAKLVWRYGFLAVPVVDDANRLLGLVTVDDVIDVFREEATEDILKMAGAGEELAETRGVMSNLRVRFPWLLASCLGGLLGAAVLGLFEATLGAHQMLALFLPIILGMSGNVGTQAATVTVRSLALGHIGESTERWSVVRVEGLVGLTMGALYGVVVGVVAGIFGGTLAFGASVGLAFIAGMTVASTVGASIPIVLDGLGLDPAVATGPFVTTTVDVLGIGTYFGIATLLLGAGGPGATALWFSG